MHIFKKSIKQTNIKIFRVPGLEYYILINIYNIFSFMSEKYCACHENLQKNLKSSYCTWFFEHFQDADVLNSIFEEKAPL